MANFPFSWNVTPKNGINCFFSKESFERYSRTPSTIEERLIQTLEEFQKNTKFKFNTKKSNKGKQNEEQVTTNQSSGDESQISVKAEVDINIPQNVQESTPQEKTNKGKNTDTKSSERENTRERNFDTNARKQFNDTRLCSASIPPTRKSSLTHNQHSQYLILYQKYANMRREPYESEMIEHDTFKKFRDIITEEQKEFMVYLQRLAKANKTDYTYMRHQASRYMEEWENSRRKEVEYYMKYYNTQENFLLHVPSQIPLQMVFTQPLLELGTVPKMVVPNLSVGNRPIIPTKYEDIFEQYPPAHPKPSTNDYSWNHEPCSRDTNAESLATGYKAHVVMSSSSFQCLMDNHAPDYDREWELPVVIKEYEHIEGDKKVLYKVVYIDRPFKSNNLIIRDKNTKFYKYAFKTYMSRPGQMGHVFSIARKMNQDQSTSSNIQSPGSKVQSLKKANEKEEIISPQSPMATEMSGDDLFNSNCTGEIEDLETFGTGTLFSKKVTKNKEHDRQVSGDSQSDMFSLSETNMEDLESFGTGSKAVQQKSKKDGSENLNFEISNKKVVSENTNTKRKTFRKFEGLEKDSKKLKLEDKNVQNSDIDTKNSSAQKSKNVSTKINVSRSLDSKIESRQRLSSTSSCDSESEKLMIADDIQDSSQDDKTYNIHFKTEEYIDEPPASPDMDESPESPCNETPEKCFEAPASPNSTVETPQSPEKEALKTNFISPGGRKCVLIPLQRDSEREENVIDHTSSQNDALFATPPLIPKIRTKTRRTRSSSKSESFHESEGESDSSLSCSNRSDSLNLHSWTKRDESDVSELSKIKSDTCDDSDTEKEDKLVLDIPSEFSTVAQVRKTRRSIKAQKLSKYNEEDQLMKTVSASKASDKIGNAKNDNDVDQSTQSKSDNIFAGSDSILGSKVKYRTRSTGSVNNTTSVDIKENVIDSKPEKNSEGKLGTSKIAKRRIKSAEDLVSTVESDGSEKIQGPTTRRSKRSLTSTDLDIKVYSSESKSISEQSLEMQSEVPVKRGRGRPRKMKQTGEQHTDSVKVGQQCTKGECEEDKKCDSQDNLNPEESLQPCQPKRLRGRPPKNQSKNKNALLQQKEGEQVETELEKNINTAEEVENKNNTDTVMTTETQHEISADTAKKIQQKNGPDIVKMTECENGSETVEIANSRKNNVEIEKESGVKGQKLGQEFSSHDQSHDKSIDQKKNTSMASSKEQAQNEEMSQTFSKRRITGKNGKSSSGNSSVVIDKDESTKTVHKGKKQMEKSKDKNYNTLDTILQLQEKMLHMEGPPKVIAPPVPNPVQEVPPTPYKCPDRNNVTYSLWSLGGFRIILRCGYHGIFKNRRQETSYIHVLPKLEYQSLYGREVLTPSETCRSYFSTYIRPNTRLIRARINPVKSELIAVENLGLEQIIPKTQAVPVFSPAASFEMLHNILQKLYQLPSGQYLLHHKAKSPEYQIKKATENNKRGAYDLHFQYLGFMSSTTTAAQQVPWIPIDTSIILSLHKKQGRVPATFEPKDFRKKKKKKKQFQKQKNQAQKKN